jgi:TonB family protein
MDKIDEGISEWLVTATAACALAACLAGLLREPPSLSSPSRAQPEPTLVTWVRLPTPAPDQTPATSAARTEEPSIPTALPDAPRIIAPLATPTALPSLADLPTPGKAARNITSQPNAPARSGDPATGPVVLNRESLGGSQPWPEYPAAALRRGEAGTVTVRLSVNPRGEVTEARVAGSSGWRSLDEAATGTIRRRWSFPPGAPRDYLVDIRFQIL